MADDFIPIKDKFRPQGKLIRLPFVLVFELVFESIF